MTGHKICFNRKILTIIPKLSLLPFLSGTLMDFHVAGVSKFVSVYKRGGGGGVGESTMGSFTCI